MTKRTGEAFVYYLLYGGLIKIGTTANYQKRMAALDPDAVLAVEPGYFSLETARHRQFAEYRTYESAHLEWFNPGPPLLAHIEKLRTIYDVPAFTRRLPGGIPLLTQAMADILAMLPPLVMNVRPGTLERFAAMTRLGDDACQLRWTTPNNTGYGTFGFENRKKVGAHVASHLMFVGPIPDGWHVDHVRDRGCTHRDCVWWPHLEAVTRIENLRRGDSWTRNTIKTHCVNGHEFTPENTRWYGPRMAWRQCKACTLDRKRADSRRRQEQDPDWLGGIRHNALKTHCPQGHPYSGDNLYISPSDGGRSCRICMRESGRRYREQQRAATS